MLFESISHYTNWLGGMTAEKDPGAAFDNFSLLFKTVFMTTLLLPKSKELTKIFIKKLFLPSHINSTNYKMYPNM
jgi:hypothetical protein